jgi:hypothetical protein
MQALALEDGLDRVSKRLGRTALAWTCAMALSGSARAQQQAAPSDLLPDAPLPASDRAPAQFVASNLSAYPFLLDDDQASSSQSTSTTQTDSHGEPVKKPAVLPQQKRVFGVLPNFTSVSGGGAHYDPPGWKTNFRAANRQNYDYTSIGFSLVTSAIAYAQDSHPSLSTVGGGNAVYWAYVWRGFLDKTDGSYQGSFFFPSLLHEDTRYFAMGEGSIMKRTLNAAGSVVIARNYSGKKIFNAAGLLGKVGTQAVSTTYYPAGSEDFGVLAEKFAYACLRQVGFTVLREFSPDIAAHLHRHKKQP